MTSTIALATRWVLGRRTIRIPERRQKRLVRPRRGLTQPRRPASARMAGRRLTAARKATQIEIEIAGPTVENTGNWAQIIERKVTATVAADAAITLPMHIKALFTASSESAPSRT